jgi:ribonuclease T2
MNDVRLRALLAVALLTATPAQAQLTACQLPDRLPTLNGNVRPDATRRIVAIDGYILALSWSPQHCARARKNDDFQCKHNRFGFVLHGLWPQGRNRTWPQYCRPATPLSASVLRNNLCATPSVNLLQHGWAKHGTCMTRTPEVYFDQARAAYGRVRFPDMEKLARSDRLTVGRLTAAMVSVNGRALSPRGIKVRATRDGWLEEIQICLDRRQRFAACGADDRPALSPTRPIRIRL